MYDRPCFVAGNVKGRVGSVARQGAPGPSTSCANGRRPATATNDDVLQAGSRLHLRKITFSVEELLLSMVHEEPPNKKLRYAEADLKVVVGSDVHDKKDGPLVEYHHSVVMAKNSTFVDTWLEKKSTKDESTTPMEIYFPDIPPITWKKMISIIENAVASRDCSIRDAVECLPFYHKYEFTNGCELCEHILKAYLQPLADVTNNWMKSLDDATIDMETLVNAAVLGHKLNLRTILSLAKEILRSVFRGSHNTKLTVQDIEKLVPCILDSVNPNRPGYCWDWTKDEVLSPLFPKYVVQSFSKRASCNMLTAAVSHIRVSGTMCGVDGQFESVCRSGHWESERVVLLGENRLTVYIGHIFEDWEIYAQNADEEDPEEDEVLWECPRSENAPLPPKDGWQAVSKLVKGTPKLEYIFGNSK